MSTHTNIRDGGFNFGGAYIIFASTHIPYLVFSGKILEMGNPILVERTSFLCPWAGWRPRHVRIRVKIAFFLHELHHIKNCVELQLSISYRGRSQTTLTDFWAF